MLVQLKPSEITADADLQPRAEGLSEDVVSEYAALRRSGKKYRDRIVVYKDESTTPIAYWLSEGFHRLAGDVDAGSETVECEVRDGDRTAALVNACGSNIGLKRTNADKRRAVELILKQCPDWSNRRIEEAAAVSDELVADVRKALAPQVPESGTSNSDAPQVPESGTCPEPATRTGRDGKQYPVPTKKAKAAEPAPCYSPLPAAPSAGNPPLPPASTPIDLPKPEDSPRDVLGRVLPKYLVDVFAKRADVKAVSSAIGKAAGGLKALDADAELGGFARKRPHLRLDLAAVSDWARTRLAPYCVCPCCDGDGDSGRCPSCGGRGWLTKAGLKLCSPEAQAKAASFKPGDAWEGDDPVPAGCECDGAAEPERRFAAPGVDARETPIPKHLRDLFEPDFLLDAIHDLKRLESVLQDAKSWLHWLKPESLAAVSQLIRYLEDAIPSEVCVSCGGSGKDCGSCLTSGYHPRWSCEAGQNRPPEPATLAPEKAKPAAAPKKTTPEKKSGKPGRRPAA